MKIGGIDVGNRLGAKEVQQLLDAGISLDKIERQAENKGIEILQGASNIFNAPPSSQPSSPSSDPPSSPSSDPYSYDPLPPSNPVSNPAASRVPFSEVDLLGRAATSAATATITNAGLEAVERLRQAGETERLKYEVDNRIPVVQAEAKGRLDLQEIVNAGYKNIANIERGSAMFNSITSMFNF